LRANSEHDPVGSHKKSKYIFGKYLKLDEDAMNHFEFLKNIEKKSMFKNSQNEKFAAS
jgi:hypothetical protein